uniref:Shisa N-terminal domain-containing protein n=1 Tax=Mastacembelus armatus TaxID=205130 RepID=A0A3Q3RVH5_9TELE
MCAAPHPAVHVRTALSDMSSYCESYYSKDNVSVQGFACPKADSDTSALYCCGFSDLKYCCDDPNSFFPYEYGYMWWLSLGALVGLSVAAVVLLAFIITLCVLCYLFIATKPRGLDNGLPLQAPGTGCTSVSWHTEYETYQEIFARIVQLNTSIFLSFPIVCYRYICK